MGSNFDKTILILNGDKTKSSLAIKALAMDLDEKFDELDKNFETLNCLNLLSIVISQRT